MLNNLLSTINGLGDILTEQIAAHKTLTEKACELHEALVACNHEAIERISLENERVAGGVRQLENKRIAFLRDAGFTDVYLPLSQVMEKALAEVDLDEEEISALDKLSSLRAELATLVNEVDHHNQLNMTLIGQALEFQELSIQLLLNAAKGETTGYTPDGPSRDDERPGFIDGLA